MDIELLRKDMVAAMKAKDKPRKEAISSLISAVKKVAIDEGCRDDISQELRIGFRCPPSLLHQRSFVLNVIR